MWFERGGVGARYSMRDLHATIRQLLGLDQNRLWLLPNGRSNKLTDFGGTVIQENAGVNVSCIHPCIRRKIIRGRLFFGAGLSPADTASLTNRSRGCGYCGTGFRGSQFQEKRYRSIGSDRDFTGAIRALGGRAFSEWPIQQEPGKNTSRTATGMAAIFHGNTGTVVHTLQQHLVAGGTPVYFFLDGEGGCRGGGGGT